QGHLEVGLPRRERVAQVDRVAPVGVALDLPRLTDVVVQRLEAAVVAPERIVRAAAALEQRAVGGGHLALRRQAGGGAEPRRRGGKKSSWLHHGYSSSRNGPRGARDPSGRRATPAPESARDSSFDSKTLD